MHTHFFDFQKFVSENLNATEFVNACKETDLSNCDATRELFRQAAELLMVIAKHTPTKLDDQLAAIFQFGVNSNLCFMAFWKILELLPDMTPESVTAELCKEYSDIAYTTEVTAADGYVGAGFLDSRTLLQFVRLAVQVLNFIKGLNNLQD